MLCRTHGGEARAVPGTELGAGESSIFIGSLMKAGPVAALLISKLVAAFLVALALKMQRPRTVVFLNFWFVAVVSWNLAMILMTGLRR